MYSPPGWLPKRPGTNPACFVAGTPVQMAEGSFRPIEQVQEGDLVLSREEGDASGAVVAKRVLVTSWNSPKRQVTGIE